jgi:uncharacterized protein YaeQ
VKIRCDLHINGENRKLFMQSEYSETAEHLALKLSGFLLFWADQPIVSPSLQHPALSAQEFRPDLMGLNVAGEISLWVECGTVTIHKMNKLVKRYPSARLVVIKSNEHDGRRLREDMNDKVERSERVEVWSWPAADFAAWSRAIGEVSTAVGEASGRSLNLVLNDVPFATDLVSF